LVTLNFLIIFSGTMQYGQVSADDNMLLYFHIEITVVVSLREQAISPPLCWTRRMPSYGPVSELRR
jgi:hypothetical protein